MKWKWPFIAVVILLIAVSLGLVIRKDGHVAYEGRSVKEWVVLLESGDTQQEEAAGFALRSLGAKAAPELGAIVGRDDFFVSVWIWRNASSMPPGVRAKALKVAGTPKRQARLAAIRAIRLLETEDAKAAIPGLSRALHARERQVAFEAAMALATFGPDAFPELHRALRSHKAQAIEAAAYGLGEIGADAAQFCQTLINRIAETSTPAGAASLGALQKIGLPAVPYLAEVAAEPPSFRSSGALLGIASIYKTRKGWTAGAETAQSRAATFRRLINARQDPQMTDLLPLLLRDPDGPVRLVILRRIENLGIDFRSALPALVACLKDSSPEVRSHAATILGLMGRSARPALPLLQALAADTQEPARIAASDAMFRIIN